MAYLIAETKKKDVESHLHFLTEDAQKFYRSFYASVPSGEDYEESDSSETEKM